LTRRRVAVVASEILGAPGTGGAGTADSLLAVALGRHGHEVELLVAPGREIGRLSPEWERIYGDAGVQVRPLESRAHVRPPFLGPTTEVLRALQADAPDVVVADDWRGLAYAALRSRQLGRAFAETAFVVYCHGPARVLAAFARKVPDTVARFGEEVAERASLELADAVVSPSGWLLGWMRDHGWPVTQSARVVQNLWQSAALGEPAAQAPASSGVRRLAFFGQLREGKGVRIFVASLRRLEPELLEGIELVFLGRDTPRWSAERIRDALGHEVSERVSSLRFESRLERSAALQELLLPGTLAVMPSLLDNSPYAVAECIEHGIPFIAARTGGVPELVAEQDHARVLCRPTAGDLAAALTPAFSSPPGFAPARPARAPGESLEAWLDLIGRVVPARPRAAAPAATRVTVVAGGDDSGRRARRLAEHTRTVEVEVVAAESRRAGLDRAAAEWVVFLDDEDAPDDGMLEALVTAQAASGADAVTAAVRPADDPEGVQLFLGDPGALGLVENHYGVLGLVRCSLAAEQPSVDGAVDPDWLLFARLALAGAVVVSIPDPLSVHRGRPGRVEDIPGEGLAVLEAFEERGAALLPDLPQLTATLAASYARLQRQQPVSTVASRGLIRRGLRALRTEGVDGLSRRVRARLEGDDRRGKGVE
jgi:glycosyltransferase involved in cell wall biosynthesis